MADSRQRCQPRLRSIFVRILLKTFYWLFVALLIAAAAFCSVVFRRSHQLETMIAREAERQGVDPRLFAALVERCSNFQTAFADHERYGLLALGAEDGRAWAAKTGVPFDTFDLFDPQKNLQIGAWKFEMAVREWTHERDPQIWALAGWKTNRETVRAWAVSARNDSRDALRHVADVRVRGFVADILQQSRREKFTVILPWAK